MSPVIGVLALQGDFREHQAALESIGVRCIRIRNAAELDSIDALVIPGGESTTIGKIAKDHGILDNLSKLTRSGFPVFGTCAGMILMADDIRDEMEGQPLIGGLDITIRRNAFGRQTDSFETDVEIPALDGPDFRAVFIRAPWVERVGADVEVLASLTGQKAAGRIVAVRQGSLLATAFHPELTTDNRMHEYFVGMVKDQV